MTVVWKGIEKERVHKHEEDEEGKENEKETTQLKVMRM